jgi:uncharacterized protein DUF6166
MKGGTMNALTNDTEGRPCNRKVYTGCRGPEGCVVLVADGTGEPKSLDPCWELRNHSPTGFEWGYGGSGPAQLALAILAEHLGGDRAALNLYQRFKWACIAQIRGASWSLSSQEIDNCLAQLSENQEGTEFSTGGLHGNCR